MRGGTTQKHNQFCKTESLNKCDGAVARDYFIASAELSHKRSKDRMNNLHLTLIKVESEHTSQNVRRMSTESQKRQAAIHNLSFCIKVVLPLKKYSFKPVSKSKVDNHPV